MTIEYPRTLLRQFIEDTMRGYIPPEREGTPRGEAIGLSAVKYRATLFGLMNIKQKDVAKELGVSHGLLRKWHTEELFRETLDRHCREFTGLFMRNLRERLKRREDATKTYIARPLAAIGSGDLPSFDYAEIADAKYYSSLVQAYIAKEIDSESEKAEGQGKIAWLIELACAIDELPDFRNAAKMAETIRELKSRFIKAMAQENMMLLQKETLTEDDRKALLMNMKMIANFLA
jgi:hypothetical protein